MRAPHLIMLTVSSGHIDDYSNVQNDYNVIAGDTLGVDASLVTAYISLAELQGTADAHITIMNIGGQVKLNGGQIFLKDFSYVYIKMFDPTKKYGLLDSACTYQPFNTEGVFSNNYVGGIQFKNCGDYTFHTVHTRTYDPTDISTANHDNVFDSLSIQNCAYGWWTGDPNTGFGFWVNTECKHWDVNGLQDQALIHANDWFHLYFHDNRVLNTGLGDTTDTGLIDIHGDLFFYNNYINNYCGSVVRLHALALVANKNQRGYASRIFCNVWKNARKYGGPQINTLAVDTTPSYIRPGGAIVAFNTASKALDAGYRFGNDGGSAFEDFYHCYNDTNYCYGNAYDSMHVRPGEANNGQNVSGLNYLIHNGAGDSNYPDTIGNIWVKNRSLVYIDTVNMIPFNPCTLTNAVPALDYLSSSFNGVFRIPGQLTYAGAYNFDVQLIGPRQNKRRNRIVIHKP